MFSSIERALVVEILDHVTERRVMQPQQLQECLDALQAAVNDSTRAALRAQKAGIARRAAQLEAGIEFGSKGRPPTVVYLVEFGSLWSIRCLGVADTLALVNQTLEEHGHAPIGKGTIYGAGGRGWWRHIDTDNGEYDLTVRRVADLAESAEAGTGDA